jgi:hypothetical protein
MRLSRWCRLSGTGSQGYRNNSVIGSVARGGSFPPRATLSPGRQTVLVAADGAAALTLRVKTNPRTVLNADVPVGVLYAIPRGPGPLSEGILRSSKGARRRSEAPRACLWCLCYRSGRVQEMDRREDGWFRTDEGAPRDRSRSATGGLRSPPDVHGSCQEDGRSRSGTLLGPSGRLLGGSERAPGPFLAGSCLPPGPLSYWF